MISTHQVPTPASAPFVVLIGKRDEPMATDSQYSYFYIEISKLPVSFLPEICTYIDLSIPEFAIKENVLHSSVPILRPILLDH